MSSGHVVSESDCFQVRFSPGHITSRAYFLSGHTVSGAAYLEAYCLRAHCLRMDCLGVGCLGAPCLPVKTNPINCSFSSVTIPPCATVLSVGVAQIVQSFLSLPPGELVGRNSNTQIIFSPLVRTTRLQRSLDDERRTVFYKSELQKVQNGGVSKVHHSVVPEIQ